LGYFLYTVMISVLITLIFIMSNGSMFGSILLLQWEIYRLVLFL
jgi:hypothetical protein